MSPPPSFATWRPVTGSIRAEPHWLSESRRLEGILGPRLSSEKAVVNLRSPPLTSTDYCVLSELRGILCRLTLLLFWIIFVCRYTRGSFFSWRGLLVLRLLVLGVLPSSLLLVAVWELCLGSLCSGGGRGVRGFSAPS